MNILAIDQARAGGWAVFNYDTKSLTKYGSFNYNSAKYTYAQAILMIEDLVNNLIKDNNISAVFIEDIQLRRNVQSFKKLAQLQGVLINLFEKNKYLYDFIAPSTWQSYCCARGRTQKEIKSKVRSVADTGKKVSKVLSIEHVKNKFNIDTDNDNLSDAICIGEYVVHNITINSEGQI